MSSSSVKRMAAQEREVQDLNDDLKRKISEIHLAMRSGTMSPEQFEAAEALLASLKNKMEHQETRLKRISGLGTPPEAGGSA